MSNLKFKQEIDSFEDAVRFLDGEASRELCYKTVVHRVGEDAIAVQHHQTDIVTYHHDGSIDLSTGGWNSVTTVHRLHRLTPFGIRVNLKDRLTYVTTDQGDRYVGSDGITIRPNERASA